MKQMIWPVVIVVLGISLYWNRKLSRDQEEVLGRLHQEESTIKDLSQTLRREQSRDQATLQARKDEYGRLQLVYQAEKEKWVAVQQRLSTATNLTDSRNDLPGLQSKLRLQKSDLELLEQQLRETQRQETALKNKKAAVLSQVDYNENQSDWNLKAAIVDAEVSLRASSEKLKEAKRNKLDYAGFARIPQMQQDIETQKANLSRLREQRGLARQQGTLQKQATQIDGRTASDELQRGMAVIREQLRLAKLAYNQTHQDIQDVQKSGSERKNYLQQIQNEYARQKAVVTGLEMQLHTLQNQIK
jgi:hypothetical protein